MELTLSILSYHRFTCDLDKKKVFQYNDKKQSYIIGRTHLADWYLPDPERVISGQHCIIECHVDKFLIIDVSTNGLFINKSLEPLGKGNSYQLSHGDVLTLGDYEIEVSLNENLEANQIGQHSFHSDVESEIKSSKVDHLLTVTEERQAAPGVDAVNPEKVQSVPAIHTSTLGFDSGLDDNFVVTQRGLSESEAFGENLIPEDWEQALSPHPGKTNSSKVVAMDDVSHEPAVYSDKFIEESHRKDDLINGAKTDDMPLEVIAFIRGLGIDPKMVPSGTNEQWWYELGTVMEQLMSGLMDVLHQRSLFKQSSRLNQTLFKKQENNPLKFSATTEDAIHNLLNRNSLSYLTADKAITEAFSDIEKHEQALLAGVEGTVSSVMKMLSPDSVIENGYGNSIWHRFNRSYSKSVYWDNYVSSYQILQNDLVGENKTFYLDDFAKCYEAYLKGIK